MSKKKLIAIITIIVLLFAAGISVGMFLYGRGETQATDGNQTSDQGKVTDGTQDAQNPEKENSTTPGSDANDAGDNETVENDNENANNQTANNNNVANNTTNNQGNAGNGAGITTDTNIDNVGETTISRVEEQEKLVSEDFLDWWQPMTVSVNPTEIGVELPQITVKKTATVNDKISNLVYAGQDITYIVAVTNNGETAVENIEITDKIPQNTTYVEGSIKDAFVAVIEDGRITTSTVEGAKNSVVTSDDAVKGLKWTVTIQAEETVFISFKVKVNPEATGTILNNAIANGEESNEVQTSIIRTQKSSEITRLNEQTQQYDVVETAKIGDLIKYTISIENTGDVEGTTYIRDEVPVGTKFVSAQEEVTVSEDKNSMEWLVTLPVHTTITREFTVEVTSVDGLIKNVADVGGTPTNEDIIDTANIDIIKTATAVNGEVITQENPLQPVKAGDKIEYTIVVTNTGSKDLTNVLLEEQLDGIEVIRLMVDNIEKAIEKDAVTGKLIIGELRAQKEATEENEAIEAGAAVITAQYEVSYEKDIKGKGNEDGTTIPVYNKVIVTGETDSDEKVEDNDDETVPVAEDPRFEVVKTAVQVKRVGKSEFSAISGKVKDGDIVKYEIVVTNTGNTTLTNIKITDTLNVRIDSEDGELKEANKEIKTISSLTAGASETIVTYYEVNQDDMTIENQIETIKNVVKAKPEELEEKQDEEIVPINPYITRNVAKTWIGDEENKYGTRPSQITVRLYDDGVEVDVATITAAQNWVHEFTMLPKYNNDGTAIVYTITEDDVNYYAKNVPTTDMQQYTITNTLNQEMISIPVTKTWIDNDNKYNTRPSQITVRLYADGNEVQVATITGAQNWTHVFTNLPKYNGLGNEIAYTILEDNIADYDETIVGYSITNTLNPAQPTSISGTKTWVDDNDKFGARPSRITVNLMIGQNVVNSQVVTANNGWKYSFTNLPTKDGNGNVITYSIQEENVAYYTTQIILNQSNANIINITNTLNQEYITLSGTKTWYAPSTVTIPTIIVKVYQNGAQYMVNGNQIMAQLQPGNTTYSFAMLPKYSFTRNADGTNVQRVENSYEVKEDKPAGFQDPVYSSITKNGNNWVQNITNKWAQEYITINVNKNWRDLGIASSRPTIYFDLYKKVGNGAEVKVEGKTLTMKNNTTSGAITGLEKYTISPDGTTYTLNTYRVGERSVSKYTSTGPSVTEPITSNTTVSFTNTIQQENTVSIKATKVWDIPTGVTGATGIRIYVYQNGNRMNDKYVNLTYGGTTTHTFTGLPKYNFKADGTVELYTYTVQEANNEQYITTQNGNTITNKAKGIVQETITNITTTTTASPVDVVFVLDVSNSMKNNNRITNMTAAVNSAMSTIMNHNSSNRVGIVAFSSNIYDVKTATLQKIQHNRSASITYAPNYEDPNDSDRNADGLLSGINGSITVKGATYTQTGIEKGAQMLINDTGNVTGRTPILILVTDGEPTWHNENYWDIGDKQGISDLSWDNNKGYNTSPKNVYYTILTANYWKEQIRQKYGIANVFTLGMDMDTRAAKATLEPTETNIKNYSNLKNYFAGQNMSNYNYADSSYMGSNITTADLISKLNAFVNNSHTITTTTTKRMVTTAEISSKEVVITNVDTSKPFTITCAKGNYTLETAKTAGIVVQNGTKITVKLEEAGLTSQIYITYNK